MVKTTKEMITEIKETKINFKAKEINAQYAIVGIIFNMVWYYA